MTQEDREFITLLIQGSNAKSEYQFDILNNRLEKVEKHLEKQNGRIGKGEEAISMALEERAKNREHQRSESERIDNKIDNMAKNHVLDCPQNNVLQEIKKNIIELEKESFSKKEMKKMLIIGLGVLSTILIIAVNFDKIIKMFI